MKYTEKEILEILKSNHRQRIQIEKGIPTDEDITFELTIRDWITDLELLDLSLIHISEPTRPY